MPFFLVDCNQFFVACEQLFNPKLWGKPVVVLSNNDGCVIARSKEAKALGIPMGAPSYQYQELFKKHKVASLSSNFALYADMSRRVMQVLSTCSPRIEEYSIDEAFLFGDWANPLDVAAALRDKVLRWTRIEVSIGIGPTKTLAKVASDLAKKSGIFASLSDEVLAALPVKEIWGIGSKLSTFLCSRGISTAYALKQTEDAWIKKHLSIAVLRTVWELRGIPCFSLQENPEPQKSLTHSRSFGAAVHSYEELSQAIAHFAARAAEKLRRRHLLSSSLTLFFAAAPFPYEMKSATYTFAEPTAHTPLMIARAKELLSSLYQKGRIYKKAGIYLGGLVSQDCYQRDFLQNPLSLQQKKGLQLFDAVNARFGPDTLRFAAEGPSKPRWGRRAEKISPRFTTCWEELLSI